MTKISKPEYLSKVKLFTKEETERLLSRMGGKLDRRLEKNKLSREEALALQLELEDEQLQEWRKMMRILKKKEETKKEAKAKPSPKPSSKPKALLKAKTSAKTKTPLKANVPGKNAAEPSKQ